MSRTIDYVITFAVGLTAGAVCAKLYYESKYKALADEEIESVKEAYRDLSEHKAVMEKFAEEKQEDKDDVEENEEIVREYIRPVKPEEPTDYHNFYKNTEKAEVKMAEREFPREEVRPRIITQEEYDETEPGFDKMSCTFYVPDKLIVDDLSREVVEPDIIGEENIEFMLTTNEPIICIRNELISVDMEISRDESSAVEVGDVVWRG